MIILPEMFLPRTEMYFRGIFYDISFEKNPSLQVLKDLRQFACDFYRNVFVRFPSLEQYHGPMNFVDAYS